MRCAICFIEFTGESNIHDGRWQNVKCIFGRDLVMEPTAAVAPEILVQRALGIAEYLLTAVRGVGRIIAVGRGRVVVDEPMRNWCGTADGIRGGGTSRLSQWRDARARLCTETIAKGTPERKWWLHCFDLGHNSRPLGIGNDRFWRYFFILGLFTYFLYANSNVVGAEIFDSSELDRIFQNERESAVIAACAGNVDRNGVTLRIKTAREKLELKDEPDRYFPLDGGLTPWLRVFRLEECNSEKEYYMVRIYIQGDWDYALIDWHSGRMTSLTSNNWNFRADRKSFVVVNDPDSGFVGSVQYVERNASLGWRLIWLYETTASRQEFIGWISDDEFLVRFVRYQSLYSSAREWTMRFRIMPVGFIAVDE